MSINNVSRITDKQNWSSYGSLRNAPLHCKWVRFRSVDENRLFTLMKVRLEALCHQYHSADAGVGEAGHGR